MLDITFYSQDKKSVEFVDVSEEFYEWLSRSDFSGLGKSEQQKMKGDEETVQVSVVLLEGENRRKLSNFLRDAIVQESDEMLRKLGDSPSKQEYLDVSYRLKCLQNLRKCVEDENIKYLSRE
ncbi:hypothetical protein IQ249_13435 [Lusitaniella coriacea LEGE 07157]|uniref:Uncharacterized protein n=1 Tax=Lusitaniella coriacea LEGE 07157 TaxID=945747 RepID=A0A8J7DX63_9CYAN|nr:hypothetical protein [Lusitaniella coriacea]MBE9116904.1 hypothetical protein [Lusitaniella coriacea LEGE 07157]